jgi:DNA-directed RNA polymerase I, II, and III subunit RPABC2
VSSLEPWFPPTKLIWKVKEYKTVAELYYIIIYNNKRIRRMSDDEREPDYLSEEENENENDAENEDELDAENIKIPQYKDYDEDEDKYLEDDGDEPLDDDYEEGAIDNIIGNPEDDNDMDDDNDEDDYEDDDNDEDYLKKFDENIKKTIIEDYHPELKQHNYEEIEALSTVVRDDNGNIIDLFHKTIPVLTKYEKSRILGERAKQINAGGKPFIEVEQNVIDGYLIALKELEEKKIPFIVKRPLPNGGCEYWKLKDLETL